MCFNFYKKPLYVCTGVYMYVDSIFWNDVHLTEGWLGEEEWGFSWDVYFKTNAAMCRKFEKIPKSG